MVKYICSNPTCKFIYSGENGNECEKCGSMGKEYVKKYNYSYQCNSQGCGFQWFSNILQGVECPKCKSKDFKSGHNRFGHDVGPMELV